MGSFPSCIYCCDELHHSRLQYFISTSTMTKWIQFVCASCWINSDSFDGMKNHWFLSKIIKRVLCIIYLYRLYHPPLYIMPVYRCCLNKWLAAALAFQFWWNTPSCSRVRHPVSSSRVWQTFAVVCVVVCVMERKCFNRVEGELRMWQKQRV